MLRKEHSSPREKHAPKPVSLCDHVSPQSVDSASLNSDKSPCSGSGCDAPPLRFPIVRFMDASSDDESSADAGAGAAASAPSPRPKSFNIGDYDSICVLVTFTCRPWPLAVHAAAVFSRPPRRHSYVAEISLGFSSPVVRRGHCKIVEVRGIQYTHGEQEWIHKYTIRVCFHTHSALIRQRKGKMHMHSSSSSSIYRAPRMSFSATAARKNHTQLTERA